MARKDTIAERRTRLTCIEIAAALDGVSNPDQCVKAATALYAWVNGNEPESKPTPSFKVVK